MRLLCMLVLLLATLVAATDAEAGRRGGSTYEELVFVADVDLSDPDGRQMSLCILTETHAVMFAPLYTSVQGYALAENRCEGDSYYSLTADDIRLGQTDGTFPAGLPAEPALSNMQMVERSWGGLAIALIIAFAVLGWVRKQILATRRNGHVGRNADAFTRQVAYVMGLAANADGKMAPEEIETIRDVLRRVTGADMPAEAVAEIVKTCRGNLTDNEFRALAKGMNADHKELLVKAALMVVGSDGDISRSESIFVSKLAAAMSFGQAELDRIVDTTFNPVTAPAE